MPQPIGSAGREATDWANHINISISPQVKKAKDINAFIDIEQVPVFCNVLLPTYEGAISARKANLCMIFCRECGHVFNSQFDPELLDYTQEYETSLDFSPRFQEYAKSLAHDLIDQFHLPPDKIEVVYCAPQSIFEDPVAPELVEDVRSALADADRPDYITLAGSGEPTLHVHLDEIIARVKKLTDIPVAVPVPSVGGFAQWDIDVPKTTTNIGRNFAVQFISIDLAANALGLVLSDTARGVVGI